VIFLLERSCRYDVPNKEGKTALQLALENPALLEKLKQSKFGEVLQKEMEKMSAASPARSM
jgi:hypothetical protein